MQLIREGSAGVGIFTQTVAHHPVDSVVGLKPQHIAQIIMFAVPDQQPLSGSVFPEESILVLVQRIHTVVAVNIREEELHTVFNHGVTVAHGESIDIGCHGCVNFCAERLQLVLPFGQTLAEYIRIDKIIEVQIVGRNTDFAFLDKTGKVGAILLAGLFPELLYAVQRFAVPAEVSIFRLTHHGQHGFDIVDLNCNNAFLQIRVAYVRVGMMDNIDRLDGMCHDKYLLIFDLRFSGESHRLLRLIKCRRFYTGCATMHTGTGQEIPAFSGSRRPVFSSRRKQVMQPLS